MTQLLLPNRYLMVPRTLLFIRNKDEILLIKGAEDKKLWPGLYNGIGGHVERGEDLISSAERELYEETGLLGVKLDLRGIIFIDVNDQKGIVMYILIGSTSIKKIKNSTEGVVEWIKINEVHKYPLVEDLYELIPKIFSNEKKVLIGRYSYEEGKLSIDFNE